MHFPCVCVAGCFKLLGPRAWTESASAQLEELALWAGRTEMRLTEMLAVVTVVTTELVKTMIDRGS